MVVSVVVRTVQPGWRCGYFHHYACRRDGGRGLLCTQCAHRASAVNDQAWAIPRPALGTPARYLTLRRLRPWLFCLVGILIASIYLFPVYWMVISALKGGNELNASTPT